MGFGTDPQMLIDIKKYKKMFNYNSIIETGTYAGTSSMILSYLFDNVYTCDNSLDEEQIRQERFATRPNITFLLESSLDCLPKFFKEIGDDKFFLFLDAHWNDNYPVLEELQLVADHNLKPFIFIHDFDCGHEGWVYDTVNGGKPLNYEHVKEKMDLIYGVDGYVFEVSQESQNEPNGTGEPNLRGCGFFYPKI